MSARAKIESQIKVEVAARAQVGAMRSVLRLDGRELRLIAMMLAIKVLIFVFGAQSHAVLTNSAIENVPRGWFEIWNRWDAPHYLQLAEQGYKATVEDRLLLVFYPLYPWVIRLFALVFGGSYVASAFCVSGVASLIAGLLLYRLARLDCGAVQAERAVWFLFVFPTSYFLHIAYTESLFLALALGSFLAARQKRWMIAGALGALASLTRVNGLILIPALGVEALWQWRESRRIDWRWLWIAAVGFGFAGYLLLNAHVTGDALAFQTIMREHWFKSLTPPWNGLRENLNSMWWRSPSEAQMIGAQELIFAALGLFCAVLCWIKLRPSYAVWITLNWLLITSTSFVLSVPRYTLLMFPIFLLFAEYGARRFWNTAITVWSLLFLALFVSQFVEGHWAF